MKSLIIFVIVIIALAGCSPSSTTTATPTASIATSVEISPVLPRTSTKSPATTALPGIGARTKTSECKANGPLPDSACTPGAIFLTVLAGHVCEFGYAKSVRNVSTAGKDAVYAEYGIASHSTGQYKVDHLISLELGGTNDIANLWPEAANPTPGFHQKDQIENELHARVCNGSARLADVQRQIAANWLELFKNGVAASPSMPGDSALDVADATATPLPVVQATATQASAAVVPAPTSAPAPAAGLSFVSVVGGPPGGKATASVQSA